MYNCINCSNINFKARKVFAYLVFFYLLMQASVFLKIRSSLLKSEVNSKIDILKNKKWIVITSINEPTKQMKKLSNQDQFIMLVVADLKTNQSWPYNYKNTILLSVKRQLKLNFKSIHSTPFNSYTRKNIGYLYAIQTGAQFIYDTDDDNEPINQLINYFDFSEYKTELEYDAKSPLILNPYAHFGQPTIWPRGYPVNKINKPIYNDYICSKKLTSIIQQSVVNGDPDVDAIFRLTKSLDKKQINLLFDDTSPSIRIPKYKLTPFNSQNTLFHYKAFWALYLPHSVSFRLTDIWRSYWSQRLMWLLNSTISFYGPNAFQLRNIHSYFSDFKQENDMYLKTKELIDFLYRWKCKFDKLFLCVLDLSKQMAINRFWDTSELISIKNWLDDLHSIGYIEPSIVNFEYELSNLTIKDFLRENKNKIESNEFRVRYTPEFQLPFDLDTFYENAKNKFNIIQKVEIIDYFINYCQPNGSLKYDTNNLRNLPEKKNVLLLFTFNHEPILENIIFLNYFYKMSFRNIAFCGRNILNLVEKSKKLKKFDYLTLIEFDTIYGYFHYECMSKAIEMNYNVDGILLMSDDVFFKSWDFNLTITNKIMFHTVPNCIFDVNADKNWFAHVKNWMKSSLGKDALNKLSFNLEKILNKTLKIPDKEYKIYQKYFFQHTKNSNGSSTRLNKVCKYASDVFYVPRNLFNEFKLICKLFSSNNVFLEFAVPTILSGLIKDAKSVELFRISYYWGVQFDLVNNYNVQLAHPFKLTQYKSTEKRQKLCEKFIQDNLKRI